MTIHEKAFPSQGYKDGMNLRDYFAAKAMQSILKARFEDDADVTMRELNQAYEIADGMMKARNI